MYGSTAEVSALLEAIHFGTAAAYSRANDPGTLQDTTGYSPGARLLGTTSGARRLRSAAGGYHAFMVAPLRPDAGRFLKRLAAAPTQHWLDAARAYARASRALGVREAGDALRETVCAAAREPEGAAVSAELTRRIDEAVRALRPAVPSPRALRAMRRSATVAAHALAFRDRLPPDVVAILTGALRDAGVFGDLRPPARP